MAPPLRVTFAAGQAGRRRVERISAVCGDSLPLRERIAVLEGQETQSPRSADWLLRGVTSNTRYTNRMELNAPGALQAGLHRPSADCAARIPFARPAHGGIWRKTSDTRFSRSIRAISASGRTIFRPSPGACIIARTWGKCSTFSPGSNMHPTTPRPSRTWLRGCMIRRSGATLTERSTSGCAAVHLGRSHAWANTRAPAGTDMGATVILTRRPERLCRDVSMLKASALHPGTLSSTL